jgi:hypothetical protein
VLRLYSEAKGATTALGYTAQLQGIMVLCLGIGGVILALHAWISRTFPRNPKGSTALRRAAERRADAARLAASNGSGKHRVPLDLEAAVKGLNYCSLDDQPARGNGAALANSAAMQANGAALPQQHASTTAAASAASHVGSSLADGRQPPAAGAAQAGSRAASEQQQQQQQQDGKQAGKPEAMSIRDAWHFLVKSPQIRCLAVMALAQVGLAWSLLPHAFSLHLSACLHIGSARQAHVPDGCGCSVCSSMCSAVVDLLCLPCSPASPPCILSASLQGITTNLLDLAWKHYLHKLATTPAAYSAFLGDTAMWTGIVTGAVARL